jgi:cbb3-type cytochrome oxidase subunit 3
VLAAIVSLAFFIVVFTAVLAAVIYYAYYCTNSNPTDPAVQEQRRLIALD